MLSAPQSTVFVSEMLLGTGRTTVPNIFYLKGCLPLADFLQCGIPPEGCILTVKFNYILLRFAKFAGYTK
jgi:hypothetical protein